jgi:hypothetical protein
MQLPPDRPVGRPPFALDDDEVATIIDLTCRGAAEARLAVTSGMFEVPITRLVRKGIRRVKQSSNLTNIQLRGGEYEIDDMATQDPAILGRIDLVFQFLHQFGYEDAYVAIECKRVGASLHQLNSRYVSEGVHRFATGQYSIGHDWGFMLGYVLVLPLDAIVKSIDSNVQGTYGTAAALAAGIPHPSSLAVFQSSLTQKAGHIIHLKHLFVDMTPAA